jgi:glycosyltransferase involved in cell wall biosynthesis/putative flippase GtrA
MLEFFLIQIHKRKQFIKFAISGGTAFSVDLLLLFFFTDILKIWYIYSASMAFVAAFFISFYLQKFWTFRDRSKKVYKQMVIFFFSGTANVMVNAGGMYVIVDKLGVKYLFAQTIMTALLSICSFLIYRFIVFKKHKAEERREKTGEVKILIATGIFPPDIGGPAAMIEELIGSLANNKFKLKVITYAETGERGKLNYGNETVNIYKINRNRNIFFKYFFYLRRLLQLAKWADVVYATDIYSVGYCAYLAKKILRKKYIIRFAGDSAWETAVSNNWTNDYIVDFQKKVYGGKIEKLKNKRKKILLNADKVIAVSRFMSDLAQMIGVKKDKIKIIYNSTDFMDKLEVNQNEVDDIRFKHGSNSKIIITSCRLTIWKGVDGIIKILPGLIKKIGNINFLVLGDGPEMEILKRLAKQYNVSGNVNFLGRVKHEETIKYFKAADLYILNSNYEGLSHALLDVMKSGVPIIATNAGGNPELIEDGKDGLLINYNNREELLNASVKILIDKQLAEELSKNAKEKVKRFNWDNTVNETVSILKNYA